MKRRMGRRVTLPSGYDLQWEKAFHSTACSVRGKQIWNCPCKTSRPCLLAARWIEASVWGRGTVQAGIEDKEELMKEELTGDGIW